MDKVIAIDPDNAGNYYDAACLHSRMGELEKAIDFLRIAFEKVTDVLLIWKWIMT